MLQSPYDIRKYGRVTDRPNYLPNFKSPPLDEVVVGVQFTPPLHYSTVNANDVWYLFKGNYPNVEEHPLLEPSFETFGGYSPRSRMGLQLKTAPLRNRLWFISDDQNHLIQFQEDRLLLNWRRRSNDPDYPHFESIAGSFHAYLNVLQDYFLESFESKLDISQAEVSYINIINVNDHSRIGEWFNFFDLHCVNVESVSSQFTEVINGPDDKPFARMIYELQSVVTRDGNEKAFRFSLTFRGKPSDNKIADAMDFLYRGRETIVSQFKNLTTEAAHSEWEIVE